MQSVTIYTSAVCPYCVRAKQLLNSLGVEQFTEIRVDINPEMRAQMLQLTGRRTVPQIFIGSTHVGGFDDLQKLHQQNQLLTLLNNN